MHLAGRIASGLGRSVYRYLQLDRDLNDLTPLKGTGRPRLIPTEFEPILLEQIQAKNDLTLKEHCTLWKKRTSMNVSVTCMFESQKRANVTLKKATMPVSSRVKSQAPSATSGTVVSIQGFRSRTIAFKMPISLRMHATNATFLAFLTLNQHLTGLGRS
jgi:transposase